MRKNKAISLVRQLLKELENDSNHTYIWTGKAKSYVYNIFGNESFQAKRFYHASFYSDQPQHNIALKKNLIKVLNDGIEIIENFGPYKEPLPNLLSKIATWLLAIIVTGLFTFAVMIGQILSDRQNFNLKQENKELK